MRKLLANLLVLTGLLALVAAAWTGFGMPAGLAATGLVCLLVGLVFIDVDKVTPERGADGKPAA